MMAVFEEDWDASATKKDDAKAKEKEPRQEGAADDSEREDLTREDIADARASA
jgi:hypothetical protein